MAIHIEKDGIKITVDTGDELKQALSALKAEPEGRRGRPAGSGKSGKSVEPKGKPEKLLRMIKGALKFLAAMQNSETGRATAKDIMHALGISEPRAIGTWSGITNRCLQQAGVDRKSVYRVDNTGDVKVWVGQSKLEDALKKMNKRHNELLHEVKKEA